MNPETDYAAAWQVALHTLFEPALALLFPHYHDGIVWSVPVKWVDEYWKPMWNPTPIFVCAARVRLNDRKAAVYVQFETPVQPDPAFERQLFERFTHLNALYFRNREMVLVAAILGDEDPTWLPHHYEIGTFSHFTLDFKPTKLLTFDLAALADNPNPFAVVVMAHRAAQATQPDVAVRARTKTALLHAIDAREYDKETTYNLREVVDRLLPLPPDADQDVWRDFWRPSKS